MDEISERIVLIIKESCGGNRSEFARRINITPAYAAQIYAGARTPSDRTISDICRVFHVNEKWLRTGEGEMWIESSEREKLEAFFADVLSTEPDERSKFIASLAELPPDYWALVAEQAKRYAEMLK